MSNIKTRLTDAMKDAMRAQDKPRLGAVRLALSELKRIEVDERVELDDARVLVVLDKMLKQRRDSLSQYQAANRKDLADQEAFEITVLQEFMPAQLSEDEIIALINTAIADTGAKSVQDMGKVMGKLKPQVQGRADMAVVGQLIKTRLA
jgi:uncharacterized protein